MGMSTTVVQTGRFPYEGTVHCDAGNWAVDPVWLVGVGGWGRRKKGGQWEVYI